MKKFYDPVYKKTYKIFYRDKKEDILKSINSVVCDAFSEKTIARIDLLYEKK